MKAVNLIVPSEFSRLYYNVTFKKISIFKHTDCEDSFYATNTPIQF